MFQRPGCQPAWRSAVSTRSGKRVFAGSVGRGSAGGFVRGFIGGFICGGSALLGGGVDGAYAEVVEHGRTGAAGRGVVAVQGVTVLADVACGDFGVFQGAAGFAVGEGFAGGPFGAGGLGGCEVTGEQDRFGAASGEAFSLAAGEGGQEVLDEWVQCGGLVGFARGGGEGAGAAYREGGGDGGQDAVAAVTELWWAGFVGAPAQAWVAGRSGVW
jgi:hypothetical protein